VSEIEPSDTPLFLDFCLYPRQHLFNSCILRSFAFMPSTASSNIDYNLYFSTGEDQWIWNGKVIRDQQTWKSTLIGDTHAIFGQDSGFISTTQADFELRDSSPALDKGNFISQAINDVLDLSGKARSEANRITIGAFQK